MKLCYPISTLIPLRASGRQMNPDISILLKNPVNILSSVSVALVRIHGNKPIRLKFPSQLDNSIPCRVCQVPIPNARMEWSKLLKTSNRGQHAA